MFSQWLKKNVPEKRVGVVLPPGLGATVANLALMLADKVPVNLNFTAGRAANESAIARAGLAAADHRAGHDGAGEGFPLAGESNRPRRDAEIVFAEAAQEMGDACAGHAGPGAGALAGAARVRAIARRRRCSSPAAARASPRRSC